MNENRYYMWIDESVNLILPSSLIFSISSLKVF